MMDLNNLSIKTLGELEQQLTQLLKTMRNAKLNEHDIYQHLQALEQQVSEARREQFDSNNGALRWLLMGQIKDSSRLPLHNFNKRC